MDQRVLARFDLFHVNANQARGRHAVLAGAARDVSCARASHQRLRWDAAVIHTSAAESLALDNGDSHSRARQPNCKRRSSLAGTNYDRIISSCHRCTSKKEKVTIKKEEGKA